MGQGRINGRIRGLILTGVTLFISVLCLALTSPAAFAFTANTLADHGNVTVMEVSGNYDANNPDGTSNSIPRQVIAKEFYRLHKDKYDFLVIFSNFDFAMPKPTVAAFYTGVKNDTQGIGLSQFDYSAAFGSNSKLQGTIDMGNISNLSMDPFDPRYEFTLDTLSHEMLHRWAARVRFKDGNGSISQALLGEDGSHWSYLLNTDASLMYGNRWQDNGDGTFTSLQARKYYSPLDLYLMGMIDRAQVQPMLLIENPSIDPAKMPETNVTITGTARYITIDDIIAAEGERSPDSSSSQKEFKTAFIFITAPGTFTGDELYGIENVRDGWMMRYSALTDGMGIVWVDADMKEAIPQNPGITPPSTVTRTIPPKIEDGVAWLMNNQASDGSWTDQSQTAARDTSEALLALRNFPYAGQNHAYGLEWLNGLLPENHDYLARKIEAQISAGQDPSASMNLLISGQGIDGGWGSSSGMLSNPADTAMALRALSAGGYADQSVIGRAVDYLRTNQIPDGSWGFGNTGSVQTTADVLSVFNRYKTLYPLAENIAKGIAWLSQKQNPDGGFGSSPSTVYDTARALLALMATDASQEISGRALQYLLSMQSESGSWNESSYETALAVEALYKATVDPDLSVAADDVIFTPAEITVLPSDVAISATIRNSGRTDVQTTKVALYDGAISESHRVGEQVITVPGQSSVAVLFNTTMRDGNEHRFYLVVDPDNLIKEPNESNNTAMKALRAQPTYDFEILPADITITPNPADLFSDVAISAKITNRGTANAYNVRIRYFLDGAGGPFDIASSTADIPAGSTITDEIIWRANRSGENLLLVVAADQFNTFPEINEVNNQAVTNLTVNGSTKPNLTISYRDIVISPSPADERGNVTITALVKNEGFSGASNIQVDFYKGVPGTDGLLLGSRTVSSLASGDVSSVSFDWTDISDSGERIIYVKVDPSGVIDEISREDNDAFVLLDILSLPDLAISRNSIVFDPAAPKDGDQVAINVNVKNLGRQGASNVVVRANEGGVVIGSQTIPFIGGNAEAAASINYVTTGRSGAHQITVTVDPDNAIVEQSRDNNSASKSLGVQDASLWLTEPIFSPNGDGVKDSTQLFFSMDINRTVKIDVADKKNTTIRAFSGPEYENIIGGNVIWDGLNDKGVVAQDGQYQIKITDASGNIVGSLPVIVDNNRSPLTDAIGTKYLLNNNLTCMLPELSWNTWKWLPNESGIIFSINGQDPNTPEYTPGLYTMSPDGQDISKIVPYPFNGENVRTWYSLSPDGKHVAFISSVGDPQNNKYHESLWITDIDGKNAVIIDSKEGCYSSCSQSAGFESSDIKWSPDSRNVAYVTWFWGDTAPYALQLWVTNIETKVPVKIDSARYFGYSNPIAWSTDSSQIAYLTYTSPDGEIRYSDLLGNKTSLTPMHYSNLGLLSWLGTDKLLVVENMGYDQDLTMPYSNIKLFDTKGDIGPVTVSDKANFYVISPGKDRLAFVEYTWDTVTIIMADENGNMYPLYKSETILEDWGEGYGGNISNLLWSHDNKKIVFINRAYEQYDSCIFKPHLMVIDVDSRLISDYGLNAGCYNSINSCYWSAYSYCLNHQGLENISGLASWFYDNDQLMIESDKRYFAISTESGEISGTIPVAKSYSDIANLSPMGRYLTYFQAVEQSSACYGRGTNDLWAISSLLNLTADLRAVKNKSSIILRGIAADLNFEGYMLEYADIKTPDVWNLIQPSSDAMVVNEMFTTWVPPYEGTFYMRLKVWDKAGNIAIDRKRVSWGLSSSITNIYKSTEIFSPNGDGVKDTVSLNYTVLEPVHLMFNIYDMDNRLLRTFNKAHVSQGADLITWDGRDESGRLMPDGQYVIKVFDYEFFVELDNTPPSMNLRLSDVMQDILLSPNPDARPICNYEIKPLVVYLNGHAYDKNLKDWIIEYGEGENPTEWTAQLMGQEPFAEMDSEGSIITNPLSDIGIAYYLESDIVPLAGKTFRITVKDSAGNVSSYQSNMLEERMFLDFHSWGDWISCDHEYFDVFGRTEYPALQLNREHVLSGIETIRQDLSSITLQYWSGMQWHDAAAQYTDGAIDISWTKEDGQPDAEAFRLKAFDAFGQEYYSNTVFTKPLLSFDRCTMKGMNYLPEPLTLLKVQRRTKDTGSSDWIDYHVYLPPDIPTGNFYIHQLNGSNTWDLNQPSLAGSSDYFFRIFGLGESGIEYINDANPAACSPPPSFQLSLSSSYLVEAGCNEQSNGLARLLCRLDYKNISEPIQWKRLTYYITVNNEQKILRQFDLTKEMWDSIDLDTSGMAVGSYPIKAVLIYSDSYSSQDKEVSGESVLIVDRTLPEARIIYPDSLQTICPSKLADSKGEWFGLPVEGIAQDNTSVKKYDLYYGYGAEPNEWSPALTRKITKNGIVLVPVTGRQESGKLGDWYLGHIHGEMSLKLKVVDGSGNTSCTSTTFSVKDVIEIAGLQADKALFSPNGDGFLDEVNMTYQIDEPAIVDLKVYPLLQSNNDLVLGQSEIASIASGISHISGEGHALWDGMTPSGPAPDGYYGLAVLATDACGNTRTRWTPVEIDNTPPSAIITYPNSGDIIGNIIEIRGTASDRNFSSYTLEASPSGGINEWLLISGGTSEISDKILGIWNTYGLSGIWTVRLTVRDKVGNTNEAIVTIDLGIRKDLIKGYSVLPRIFSPNNDLKLDSAAIMYEVTDACDIRLDVVDTGGNIRRSLASATGSAGAYQIVWDGKDAAGAIVPDETYILKLTASLTSNPSVNQTETATVSVDTGLPLIDIKQPAPDSYLRTDVTVSGSITDPNIKDYSVSVASGQGTLILDEANQNRSAYIFGTIDNPDEGTYSLSIRAKDFAENSSELTIPFTVDRTPPKVSMTAPVAGEYFGYNRAEINISGSIEEGNLESFELRHVQGDSSQQWTQLMKGAVLPGSQQLFSWKVGKNDGISDGSYTLSLYAKDKAGQIGEASVKVVIDNTAPETAITFPQDNSYQKAPFEIKGTAFDVNPDKFLVEISEGTCQSAFKWATLIGSTKAVKDVVLAKMQVLPADGDYCIRITAVDKLDNRSETKVKTTIDTVPPSAPLLSGRIENRKNARLEWASNTEADIAGYDVYRGGKKINPAPVTSNFYLDADLAEGVYTYFIKANDFAGNESKSSNEVTIRADLTGPDARISTPADNSRLGGFVDVKGTAYSADDFKEYRLFVGKGLTPSDWMLVRTSPLPVSYGVLGQLNTSGMTENELYAIKLEAEDINGNISLYEIKVTIDNRAPAAPVLLSAIASGPDVQLAWSTNTEQDLSGYLLYRNEQLANVSGIVVGNLKPYLISSTSYNDKGLPDGKYRYYLHAMDSAGNLSDQSNSLELTIDTTAPHAVIVEPLNNAKFDVNTSVKAETPELDIASVQFQYKKASESVWVNLGSAIQSRPYATNLDPIALEFATGEYNLRAVATDKGGRTDPAPSQITVIYTDITPPSKVINLKSLTVGRDVTLTWDHNTEPDLDGYNVYAAEGGQLFKLNSAMIKENTFPDSGLPQDIHTYEVTAVDKSGNESKPSARVNAKVYAPVIEQPYTPVNKALLKLKGKDATAGSSVEIFDDSGAGPVSQMIVPADVAGVFVTDLTLKSGENMLTAKATDMDGNISLTSGVKFVVYSEPPATPTGLATTATDRNVHLSWDANIENNLAGYNIYRDAEKINPATEEYVQTADAYYSRYGSLWNAFDADLYTYWLSDLYDGMTWLQGGFTAPELIRRIEINWLDNEHTGKDFEIQFWSGHAWITQKRITGNTSSVNIFDFDPSYRTDRIRIYITDTNNNEFYKYVAISDLKIFKDNPITDIFVDDADLIDGSYEYRITAVNYYGFESPVSDAVTASVTGTTLPPSPFTLSATAVGNDVMLQWSPTSLPDIVGYSIYRYAYQAWRRLNGSPVADITYSDAGLPDGRYIYRVVAVDSAGNESLQSNEAQAVIHVSDTGGLSKPVIFFPTVAGLPLLTDKDRTDIAGYATPGTTVTLYGNMAGKGSVKAAGNDSVTQYQIEQDAYVYLSPDGKMLAYDLNNAVWLKAIDGTAPVLIAEGAVGAGWSPSGDKFAFYTYDSAWNYHIHIYDPSSGGISALTDGAADEAGLSWSPDGSIIFSSNRGGSYDIWRSDLKTGTLTQITSGRDIWWLEHSPRGNLLAYFENSNLYILDLLSGTEKLVDDLTDGYSFDWSQDGKSAVYVSYRNSIGDIYTYNTETDTVSRLTYIGSGSLNTPYWTEDGSQVVFLLWDVNSWTASIRIVSAERPGQALIIRDNLNLMSFGKAGIGNIYYSEGNVLNLINFGGYFIFRDVELEKGENVFSATASADPGPVSPPSDDISVIFDASDLPDLATSSDEIYFYPPVPLSGQVVSANIVVSNRGTADARNVMADIYVRDADGVLERIDSVTIPIIAAGAIEVIPVSWKTSVSQGVNSLITVIDPADGIYEESEDNNLSERDFFVAATKGISLETSLSNNMPYIGENVYLKINIANSGSEKDAVFRASIEDINGNTVAMLDTKNIKLSYGSVQTFGYSWNAAVNYPGDYKVHVSLSDISGIVAEQIVQFEILQKLAVDASVITDKAVYGPHDEILATYSITNKDNYSIIPDLKIARMVIDWAGAVLHSEEMNITGLLPGSSVSLYSLWDASLLAPGNYYASIKIYDKNNEVFSKAEPFIVQAEAVLTGQLKIAPPVVHSGDMVQFGYDLYNKGNSDATGLKLKLIIEDPDTQVTLGVFEATTDALAGSVFSGQFFFSSAGLELKTYVASLLYDNVSGPGFLAKSLFSVIDAIPPTVAITAPLSGSLFNSGINIEAVASDEASGISSVEYQIDGGIWRQLSIVDISSGRYGSTWNPTLADEGYRLISVRAKDRAGNISLPATIVISVDVTPPGLPVIVSPPADSDSSEEVVNISGTAEPGSRITMSRNAEVMTANADPFTGAFIFNGVVLVPGINVFELTSADQAGNTSGTAEYRLNFRALSLHVSTDGTKYNPGDNVTVKTIAANLASSHIFRGLKGRVFITDSTGLTIAFEEFDIQDLAGKQQSEHTMQWNTAVYPKGIYSAGFEIVEGMQLYKATGIYFEILGTSETGSGVAGSLSLKEDPITQDKEQVITYGITNNGNEDVAGASLRIVISDQETGAVMAAFTDPVSINIGGTASGIKNVPLLSFQANKYAVILQIVTSSQLSKTLAEASFVVEESAPAASLEISQTVRDMRNILVWINRQCDKEMDDYDHEGCDWPELINSLPDSYDTSYFITGRRDVFLDELRNPYFTDMAIIGDHHRLSGLLADELRERIYSGTGIIASEHFIEDIIHDSEHFINYEYGLGKIVTYHDDNVDADKITDFIIKSIDSIHRGADKSNVLPGMLVPIETRVKNLGNVLGIKVEEIYPESVHLFDPVSGKWIVDIPWIIDLSLEADQAKTILFYMLAPEMIGAYSIEARANCQLDPGYQTCPSDSVTIQVETNRDTVVSDIISRLGGIAVNKSDMPYLNRAIQYMKKIKRRQLAYQDKGDEDIRDILLAVNALIKLEYPELPGIRQQLDELMISYESRYYFGTRQKRKLNSQ